MACVDVPEWHLLLERVGIDVQDARVRTRTVELGNPRHIAVEHENRVGLGERGILALLVPLAALMQRIVDRKVEASRGTDSSTPTPRRPHRRTSSATASGIATDVGGHDQWPARARELLCNECRIAHREGARGDCGPLGAIDAHRLDLRLENLRAAVR